MRQKIVIVRGTTNTFGLTVTTADGTLYSPASGEKIIFGVKRKESDAELVFFKVATTAGVAGAFNVKITPEDTAGLDCGQYAYDVSLQSGADFFNIIPASPFVIEHEITKRGCAD